jgi:hypothetical protein
VDPVRELGRVDPWQESLERSLARRARSSKRSRTLISHRACSSRRSRTLISRARASVLLAAAILTLALVAPTVPGALDGGGARDSATAALVPPVLGSAYSTSGYRRAASGGAAIGAPGSCERVVGARGYVNPLAGARLTRERIDQGVDYAGTGTLTAIGAATVTYVGTSRTGWPGAFIEYQLSGGPAGGCSVFYAEGATPVPGLHEGETVSAGQAIATIIPGWATGIEIGWAAGVSTKTYAAQMGEWSYGNDVDNVATAAGRSFSALIASLGGPPGKVEESGH